MEKAGDEALQVRFESRSLYNKAKSEGEVLLDVENKPVESTRVVAAGRPVLDEVDFVVIEIPGEKESIVERAAKYCGFEPCRAAHLGLCDVHRFPRQWAAYKQGKAEQTQGTDLKKWPGAERSQVEELAYHKVYTVEQLAMMSDSNAERFLALKTKAKEYLAAAEKQAPMLEMRSELESRDAKIKKMEAQIEELLAAGKQAAEPKPKAKGA